MSVSGISSSSLYNYSTQSAENNLQQFQQAFEQLGQDLQSGNLSAAQADLASLQKLSPQNNSTSASQSEDPIAQAFDQLSKDLQSDNLSAAQQDYATIQQSFQNQAAQRHHHDSGGGASAIGQLLDQLGHALQSGDLSSAQQTYSTLVQQFQQSSQNGGLLADSTTQSGSNTFSVNA
jgi:molecular chaperone GrpE (heat shock protein)